MRDDWKPYVWDQTDLSTGPDPDWTPEEREIAAAQMRRDLPVILDAVDPKRNKPSWPVLRSRSES